MGALKYASPVAMLASGGGGKVAKAISPVSAIGAMAGLDKRKKSAPPVDTALSG